MASGLGIAFCGNSVRATSVVLDADVCQPADVEKCLQRLSVAGTPAPGKSVGLAVDATSTTVLLESSQPFSNACIPVSHCSDFLAMEKLDMTVLWQAIAGVSVSLMEH